MAIKLWTRKSILTAMKAKKQKKFLFKVNLNCCRQNTDYKSILSLSFPFFIPLGPCSRETQAGPSFYTTASDTCPSAQESATEHSLDGLDFEESCPEPSSLSKHLKLIPQNHLPSGPQLIATSIFRHLKLSLLSQQMISLIEQDCFWVIFSLVLLIWLFPLPATIGI